MHSYDITSLIIALSQLGPLDIGAYDPRKLSEPGGGRGDRRPSVTVTSPGSPDPCMTRLQESPITGRLQVGTRQGAAGVAHHGQATGGDKAGSCRSCPSRTGYRWGQSRELQELPVTSRLQVGTRQGAAGVVHHEQAAGVWEQRRGL